MGALPILFRGGSASKKDGCLLPRVPLRPPFPSSKGSGQIVVHCARRTSTFLSCAFREQEGHLAAPFPTFSVGDPAPDSR
jgi:hypothetical protein